jgi:4-amino-4-deoxy-L-arabinose transferase-like glycosyltransferase
MRKSTIFILGILIFSGVLRIINLNQSVWLDEATTALTTALTLRQFFSGFIVSDFHPPLYYLLIKFWVMIFGSSEVSVRIPSLLFSVGSVYLTYLVAKKLFDEKAGLIAAILIAVNGLSVYYAQEARSYSMTTFLALLMVYFYLNKKWLLFGVALAAAGMTDYVVLFMLPVFWIFAYKEKKLWYSHLFLLTIYLIWSPVFVKQLTAGLGVKDVLPGWWSLLGTLTFKNLLLIPVKFITGRVGILDNAVITISFFVALLIYLSLIQVKPRVKILWAWISLPLIIGILISFKVPTLSYFRYLFCLPGFLIMVSGSLSKFKSRNLAAILTLLIIINSFYSLTYLAGRQYHRENWRDLVKFVESEKSNQSLTVFRSNANMEAYYYYAPGAKITGPEGLNSGAVKIFLMDYLAEIYDPAGSMPTKLINLGYTENGSYNFNSLRVTEFTKNIPE